MCVKCSEVSGIIFDPQYRNELHQHNRVSEALLLLSDIYVPLSLQSLQSNQFCTKFFMLVCWCAKRAIQGDSGVFNSSEIVYSHQVLPYSPTNFSITTLKEVSKNSTIQEDEVGKLHVYRINTQISITSRLVWRLHAGPAEAASTPIICIFF